ncbi:hypothetical protein [Salipiger sp.]|uniref:hypothetical protein n=1 Tax=Salipiger sp. TaxID=2078585 RepID=UPI003A96CFFE
MLQDGSNNVPPAANKNCRALLSKPKNTGSEADQRSDLELGETISAIIGGFIDIAFGCSATDMAQKAANENSELSQTAQLFLRKRTKLEEEKD